MGLSVELVFASLTAGQRRAVEHDGGHLLVVAGAGTGKTTTLAARVARVVAGGTPPERVLLLTIAKETFVDPLSEDFALLAAPDTIDFSLLVGLLLFSCVAVSALGSGLTLRRFLRI